MDSILQTLGGLGLFLLGMLVMTDGLRAFSGNAVRQALMRFTRNPVSGAITGAVSTAILQSSSATTVTAVGFVSVGLLSFSEALGIIFGANLGTTITGWMVALIGFKLKLSALALPIVFFGALIRLFAKGRLSHAGYALSGFGLIFIGISFMQDGMANIQAHDFFNYFPADTFIGRLKLVLIGILFTIVTQSSSAGVASALTALFAGMINFEQAATLVIGMDIGTTVTAALATLGGSVETKRTGYSHVIYNILTGVGALILLSPFVWVIDTISPDILINNAELSLVAFHTTFNLLGVLIILPFTPHFAHFMQTLISKKTQSITQRLNPKLLTTPNVALYEIHAVIHMQTLLLFQHVLHLLGSEEYGKKSDLRDLKNELNKTHQYIDRIHLQSDKSHDWERLLSLIHTLDRLQRLNDRCVEQESRAETARKSELMTDSIELLKNNLSQILNLIDNKQWRQAETLAIQTSADINSRVQTYRKNVMEHIAQGLLDVPEGTEQLQAMRWLRRVSNHISDITSHLLVAVLGLKENDRK